tara:strand:- start:794 stop:1075 length:282 start_codon:yes stop_codon:yes gene_type:complete
MESNSAVDKKSFIYKVNTNLQNFWLNLSDSQRSIFKKIWSVLTYKWQWQIILNTPFLIIWILDQTIPAVHSFDMQLISSLPIPLTIKTILGFD